MEGRPSRPSEAERHKLRKEGGARLQALLDIVHRGDLWAVAPVSDAAEVFKPLFCSCPR